jgi:rhodanese-related sulfurtransferase
MRGGIGAWIAAGYSGGDPPPTEVIRISLEDVKAKLDAGSNIVIVDSRAKTAYDRSHIAGAISIPLSDMSSLSPEEIAQRYSDLHLYDEIMTYCE